VKHRFWNDNSESETETGVWIDRLPVGTRLAVRTAHTPYLIETCGGCEVLISGHPDYCPEPVAVAVYGSTRSPWMIKPHFIGRGMHLEFRHPVRGIIRTSSIRVVRKLSADPA
jgi:hypothetical protein